MAISGSLRSHVALDFCALSCIRLLLGKGNRQAGAAGAAGAADAVHIIFAGLFGQVVVDHMGDAGHVNAGARPRRWPREF